MVANSSRRLLAGIQGVEAAKYGHTRAAGHNGMVYVRREGRSLVAVMFGASTTRDPDEMQNLFDDPSVGQVKADLTMTMLRRMIELQDRSPLPAYRA